MRLAAAFSSCQCSHSALPRPPRRGRIFSPIRTLTSICRGGPSSTTRIPQVTFDPTLDVNSSPSSGSALYAKPAGGSTCYPNLYQCVGGITPGKPYDYGGWAYIPIGQPALSDAFTNAQWFTGPACSGVRIVSPGAGPFLTYGAWSFNSVTGQVAPAGAASALVDVAGCNARARAGAGQFRFALPSGEHGAAAFHRHFTLRRGAGTRGSRRSSGVSRAGHEPRAANRDRDSRRRLPATGTCRLDCSQRWNLTIPPKAGPCHGRFSIA